MAMMMLRWQGRRTRRWYFEDLRDRRRVGGAGRQWQLAMDMVVAFLLGSRTPRKRRGLLTVACLDALVERTEVAEKEKANDLTSSLEMRRRLPLSAPER